MDSIPVAPCARLHLAPGKGGATYGGHPWLMSRSIARREGKPVVGDIVDVFGERGEFLARGVYNPNSQIETRLYAWHESEQLDWPWFDKKLAEAIRFRREFCPVLRPSHEGRRLIFSEGDGLSGLVVDQYGDYLVMQITSYSMFQRLSWIIETLVEQVQPRGILLRAEEKFARIEGFPPRDEVVYGTVPETMVIEENGVNYQIDLVSEAGPRQKTGFFLDQRENRAWVQKQSRGKRVLDLCTYTGGFALNALLGGAQSVVGVDASRTAIERANENLKLNHLPQAEFVCSDAFQFLQSTSSEFDLVILDPPRLAVNRAAKKAALRAYFKWNEEAIKVLRPGGLFATFSCSGLITREEFLNNFVSVVRRAGRQARILDLGIQPPDHPILAACPETAYLKSLFAQIL